MSKNRYRKSPLNLALRSPGSAQPDNPLLAALYKWSGLPYVYNDQAGHWLVGLGLFVLGVAYLQQITWEAVSQYQIDDGQTKVAQLQAEIQDETYTAAQLQSLETIKRISTDFVPVTDVVFVTR
jgi:hypothetical protein